MCTPSSTEPTAETLRQQLDVQWRDHFQTREQTWKALQMVALLFIGYIGSGLKVESPRLILAGGFVCILAAFFGIIVTIHHRRVQILKFAFIHRLEEKLGLHAEILKEAKEPEPFRWSEILDLKKMATPTYVLLMHVAILLLTGAYLWVRH